MVQPSATAHKLGDDDDLYETLFPGQEIIDFTKAEDFRDWIEAQPATVTNADGTKTGDPLNLVVVGDSDAVWPAFLRSGWDPTAAMTAGSMLKTGAFGIFGGKYRYSPISDLYVYGRAQDIAVQKVRTNIHYRNHLRLWLAPVTFHGLPVMIGQISRDIGSRFTTKSSTLTTHRIDPNVEETRSSFVQDFIYAQALKIFARAGGVGFVSPDEPRGNLTSVPFGSGIRIVSIKGNEVVDSKRLMVNKKQSLHRVSLKYPPGQTVIGRVSLPSGKPYHGNVRLNYNNEKLSEVATDSFGKFKFENVSPGNHKSYMISVWPKDYMLINTPIKVDGKPAREVMEERGAETWKKGGFFSSPQRAIFFEYRLPFTGKRGDKHVIEILERLMRSSILRRIHGIMVALPMILKKPKSEWLI